MVIKDDEGESDVKIEVSGIDRGYSKRGSGDGFVIWDPVKSIMLAPIY